jgi:hypothetical protein
MSRSSSSTTASKETTPVVSSTPEMSPLEGLEDAPIYEYKSIRNLQERVDSQSAALTDGRTNQQYLVFMGVRKDDLEKIVLSLIAGQVCIS